MGRPRKFDWDEAARLYAETKNYKEVARRLGISVTGLRRVLIPSERAASAARHARWQSETRPWIGVCPDCGGAASTGKGQSKRCRDCDSKHKTTSVRDDTLLCTCCRIWLPDESFPLQARRKMRRGRHATCTPCGAVMKRDWRHANREREQAKDRERKRRSRAAA